MKHSTLPPPAERLNAKNKSILCKSTRCNLKLIWIGLITSLLVNFGLMFCLFLTEHYSNFWSQALIRRDIISYTSIDDELMPDYWARKGWINTIEKLHTDFDIAFFGNSITRGSDFQEYFPDKKIINLGYAGDNITGMIRRVPMLQAANPKKIFIMAGTNDIFHINTDALVKRYTILLNEINDSIPNATVYIQSILPMNQNMYKSAPSNDKIIEANNAIKNLADQRHIRYIDLYSLYVDDNVLPANITKDGIHIYPQYYQKWADKVKPFIYE
jgi:lysophospholipase L1-like esterase